MEGLGAPALAAELDAMNLKYFLAAWARRDQNLVQAIARAHNSMEGWSRDAEDLDYA